MPKTLYVRADFKYINNFLNSQNIVKMVKK